MKRMLLLALTVVASATLSRASAQPVDPTNKTGARVLPSEATAQPASPALLPAAPGNTYRMIMPLRFDTFNSDTQFAFELGGRYVTAGTPAFGVQLDLPQGAKVQDVTLFFVDNGAGAIDMTLYEQTPDSTAATALASVSTAGVDAAAINSISLAGSPITVVDNAQRTLHVEITLPSASANHRVHGLRVGYTYVTTFLPLLRRE